MPPKPPTEQERIEDLARQDRWRRSYVGLDQDGVQERAAELVAMRKAPAFSPMPTAEPIKTRSNKETTVSRGFQAGSKPRTRNR